MTRISDLPEMSGAGQSSQGDAMYMPMNIHPNPYGIQNQIPGGMPHPQSSPPSQNSQQYQNTIYPADVSPPDSMISNGMTPEQIASIQQMPIQRLPQRDIPMNMGELTQDEQIKPNYIPRPKITSDYIKDYEETTERKVKEYENKKQREKSTDSLFNELQIPILIAILFFIFQMPIINTIVFKRCSFLSIYNDDGNFNFNGLILKCIFFGGAYYFIEKSMKIMSEF